MFPNDDDELQRWREIYNQELDDDDDEGWPENWGGDYDSDDNYTNDHIHYEWFEDWWTEEETTFLQRVLARYSRLKKNAAHRWRMLTSVAYRARGNEEIPF